MTTPTPVARRAGPGAYRAGAGRRPLRLRLDRNATFWGLVVPPSLWLALFFLVPLVLIAVISLRPDLRGGVLASFPPTLDQYRTLFEKPAYLRLFGTSVGMALAVAAAATVLAFPIAYFLAFRAGRHAGLVPGAAADSLLDELSAAGDGLEGDARLQRGDQQLSRCTPGLAREPVEFLLYNRFAVIITLVYVWIPFVALPILAGLQRIDPTLFEAAADLGSTPLRRFWRVVLPLSLPGVIAGFFMCFIPTVGEYVTPLLVGGSAGSMYGNLIQDFFTKAANWPLGAAMSLVMLVGTLAFVAIALRLIDPRQLAA